MVARWGKIAFVSQGGANTGICVIDTDGKNEKRVADVTYAMSLAWSPDGKKIAYLLTKCIYIVDINRENKIELTAEEGENITGFNLSPDGKKIVFTAYKIPDYRSIKICVIDIDTKKRTELASSKDKVYYSSPIWSPDGRKIAYVKNMNSGKGYEQAIYIMDADGENEKKVRQNSAVGTYSISGVKWIDNHIMTFWAYKDSKQGLYVTNIFGGSERKIADLKIPTFKKGEIPVLPIPQK